MLLQVVLVMFLASMAWAQTMCTPGECQQSHPSYACLPDRLFGSFLLQPSLEVWCITMIRLIPCYIRL
jgi:hypothetical protein